LKQEKIRFYMDLAVSVSKQGTCPRAGVGAVIVRDDRVLSLGFNGSPRYTPHCKDAGCWIEKRGETVSCVRSVHAEANAIANAAYMGVSTKGGYIFTTHYPCVNCLKLIINAGISQIFYEIPYDDEASKRMAALGMTSGVIEITRVERS